ncbi:MAG: transglycosylase domain-containing protein, partial [Alphaproteobacteria bacterium]
QAVADQTPPDVEQVAVVVMGLDGAVRAMVGGRNYRDSQFNRATQALRQPGSAFKPFVYLAALEAGLTPDTKIEDAPISVDGWSPRNFGRKFRGTVTMREAVARSLNSVAVRVSEQVGRGTVAQAGHRLGLVSQLKTHPSLALGASEVTLLELTAAYSVFANGGEGVLPHGIREIRDGGGDVLYRRTGSGTGRVIERAHAQTMNQLLNAVVEWGTGKAAKLDRPAAGKTGTSQEFRDAWFVGYTSDLVAGVWMGNDNGRPMAEVSGGGAPAKLWQRLMQGAHKGAPIRPLLGVSG